MQEQLHTIKRRRLHEDIVQQFHELINLGKLLPGERLPSERDLACQFNVSRSSVREAIRSMELQGLVVSKPGSGTFISELYEDSISDLVAAAIRTETKRLSDIFEIRHLMEPAIAGLAAVRASKEDLQNMRQILQTQKKQIENGETGVESDTAFHFALALATHNTALVSMVNAIEDILTKSRDESLQRPGPGRPQRSLESHLQILTMIEQGDSNNAVTAMEHHLTMVEPATDIMDLKDLNEEGKVPVTGNATLV
ncbi:MAG: FadR/GntR family transcriptional regulator [Chloroflexota bacterium]|nr:FadR/GntR family transcriptional regulator [Chloroflexota bacterium]